MQKLRVLTVLLFVSITMSLGACAEDETLNEVENTIEATSGGDEDDKDNGGTSSSEGAKEENEEGGM